MSRIITIAIRSSVRPIGQFALITPKMPTRTSSRQAAQKAKEAISDPKDKPAAGAKRKGASDKPPAPKRGKKAAQQQPEVKEEDKAGEQKIKPETVEEAPQKEELTAQAEGDINECTSELAPNIVQALKRRKRNPKSTARKPG